MKNDSEIPLENHTILLVEDYLINQKLIVMMLETLGATVEIANDGLEAVKMASAKNYSVVLMDLNMPKMNGIEATKLLKIGGVNTPVLCMTVENGDQKKREILDSGMKAIISKPCQLDELRNTILKYA